MTKRIVAHLDMDAFFASLEERDNPQWNGMAIVVGSDPKNGDGRGVVSTANYKAREYGIRSALPISVAWRYSQKAKNEGKPEAIFLPPDFERYEKASGDIFEIIKKYSKSVEPASIDEFYFDLSSARSFEKAKKICQKIKDEIKIKVRVTCSVGIGSNKLIAKISAGMKKPDGLVVVKENDAENFLEKLPIRNIPGIGPKTELYLHSKNVKIVKDLKRFSREELKEMLGKWGESIYFKARGIDESPIVENKEAKSIGEQTTFQEDTLNSVFICQELKKLCEGVFKSFKESEFKSFKTIAITVRFYDFETKTSAKTFKKEMEDKKMLMLESLKLLLPFFDRRKNPRQKSIRLVGVRVEKLKI